MNALNVIGTAVNLAFFVLVLAGTLAILDEEGKTSVIQILFCICLEICFALNIFLICTRRQMYLPIPIGIIPIELIERVKFIKAPLRLNPCRFGKAYESDKSRHPE